jgi:hypothetical protein
MKFIKAHLHMRLSSPDNETIPLTIEWVVVDFIAILHLAEDD